MNEIQTIKNRAKKEHISFKRAAEKYFFEALNLCVKKNAGCVNTANKQNPPFKSKNFYGVCKHR